MPRHLKAEYPDSYGDQIKDSVRANIRGREVVVELPNARTMSRNLHTMEQGLDKEDMLSMSRVKGKLGAIFLSDIVTEDGKHLESFACQKDQRFQSKSRLNFPREEPMTREYRGKAIYLKMTFYHCV